MTEGNSTTNESSKSSRQSNFCLNLWKLLENPTDPDSLRWVEGSVDRFEISVDEAKARAALRPTFEFKSMSSFVRQLSYYNFKRMSDRRKSNDKKGSGELTHIIFSHPSGFFIRGDASNVDKMKRKLRIRTSEKGRRASAVSTGSMDDNEPLQLDNNGSGALFSPATSTWPPPFPTDSVPPLPLPTPPLPGQYGHTYAFPSPSISSPLASGSTSTIPWIPYGHSPRSDIPPSDPDHRFAFPPPPLPSSHSVPSTSSQTFEKSRFTPYPRGYDSSSRRPSVATSDQSNLSPRSTPALLPNPPPSTYGLPSQVPLSTRDPSTTTTSNFLSQQPPPMSYFPSGIYASSYNANNNPGNESVDPLASSTSSSPSLRLQPQQYPSGLAGPYVDPSSHSSIGPTSQLAGTTTMDSTNRSTAYDGQHWRQPFEGYQLQVPDSNVSFDRSSQLPQQKGVGGGQELSPQQQNVVEQQPLQAPPHLGFRNHLRFASLPVNSQPHQPHQQQQQPASASYSYPYPLYTPPRTDELYSPTTGPSNNNSRITGGGDKVSWIDVSNVNSDRRTSYPFPHPSTTIPTPTNVDQNLTTTATTTMFPPPHRRASTTSFGGGGETFEGETYDRIHPGDRRDSWVSTSRRPSTFAVGESNLVGIGEVEGGGGGSSRWDSRRGSEMGSLSSALNEGIQFVEELPPSSGLNGQFTATTTTTGHGSRVGSSSTGVEGGRGGGGVHQ